MAMVDAVETRPGTDPDRASFTTALEAARDQLTAAAGICPDDPADLPGVIGRAVLATLLPARRPRYSARKVKCATSRYLDRDDSRPRPPATITAIDITMHTPPLGTGAPGRARTASAPPPGPQPPTRRQRITAIMTSQPPRDWSGRELAARSSVKPRNMLTQLGEWAQLGFFTRTGSGTYAPQHAASPAILDNRHQTLNYAALRAASACGAPLTVILLGSRLGRREDALPRQLARRAPAEAGVVLVAAAGLGPVREPSPLWPGGPEAVGGVRRRRKSPALAPARAGRQLRRGRAGALGARRCPRVGGGRGLARAARL